MKTTIKQQSYRPTESKYKGGAHEMFVTYELDQRTRGGGRTPYPKVKRVYIAGVIKDWKAGTFQRRSGREVHGVQIEYERSRARYHREGYKAKRGQTDYRVAPAAVGSTMQQFTQVVEIPKRAQNVHFYKDRARLPHRYRHAVQHVR
jgi:hypothetical protein